MNTSRREFLALAGTATVLGGCSQLARRLPGNDLPDSVALPAGDIEPEVRLLNRAGWGPRPGDVAEVKQLGVNTWIDRQLAVDDGGDTLHKIAPNSGESPRLQAQLERLDIWQENPSELADLSQDEALKQLNSAMLLRAIYGRWPVRERMAAFWADHFNVYASKAEGVYQLGRYADQAIRDNALGNFPTMLQAVAKSPAMLQYLDNQLNRRGVANENYARELMELHTLGVHGGYTQKDVQEVARCFTGWTVERGFLKRKGTFVFDATQHDDGEKLVLGHRIPAGGGENDATQVLDIVAHHPATGKFIAGKLCRHFLGTADHPIRQDMAAAYARTGGDIKAMIGPLFRSKAFLKGPPVAKRPVDFIVSALRATGADTDAGPDVQKYLASMGQTLFEWPMPDGYPDRGAAWTGSLLARWNFSLALAHGTIAGTSIDLVELTNRGGAIEPLLLNRRDASMPASDIEGKAALCLASPEFQLR